MATCEWHLVRFLIVADHTLANGGYGVPVGLPDSFRLSLNRFLFSLGSFLLGLGHSFGSFLPGLGDFLPGLGHGFGSFSLDLGQVFSRFLPDLVQRFSSLHRCQFSLRPRRLFRASRENAGDLLEDLAGRRHILSRLPKHSLGQPDHHDLLLIARILPIEGVVQDAEDCGLLIGFEGVEGGHEHDLGQEDAV